MSHLFWPFLKILTESTYLCKNKLKPSAMLWPCMSQIRFHFYFKVLINISQEKFWEIVTYPCISPSSILFLLQAFVSAETICLNHNKERGPTKNKGKSWGEMGSKYKLKNYRLQLI